jgi:dTDP-4-amino-4,6-dideoxygalactose transaminase
LTSSSSEQVRAIPFGRPWITDADRAAVAGVLEGNILTHGPEGSAFEDEFAAFLGTGAHCVTMSSCAAALHMAYAAAGVGPGDEVIVPAQTHAATANTAEWTGATCVFVDCEPDTGNVTADRVEAAITTRTKAIAVVHFLGIPCDMPAIVELAEQRGITLVEDCALSVGARLDGTHTGLFGDCGCFSFYPVKHLTTGEGGMFVSRKPALAERVARLRAHGVDRTHSERTMPGMYDVPGIGLNYRLSELQAALGRSQLRRIDENLARRRANFETIASALSTVEGVRVLDGTGNSWYCLGAVLEGPLADRRDAIVARVNRSGVGTSLYYPQPVPRMTYYQTKYGYEGSRYPHAEGISDRSIALPVGLHLATEDAERVGQVVRDACEDLLR